MRAVVFPDTFYWITFYWIALTNPGDSYAQAALRFDDPFSDGAVYTTEEVLAEVLTFFAADSHFRPGSNCMPPVLTKATA